MWICSSPVRLPRACRGRSRASGGTGDRGDGSLAEDDAWVPTSPARADDDNVASIVAVVLVLCWVYIGRYMYECVYLTGGINVPGGFCAWETRWWLESLVTQSSG